MNRPRLAFYRFASCAGCQLTLLNCEDSLVDLARRVETVSFPMATSRVDDGGPLDIVLIEGSAVNSKQQEELLNLRCRATWLVAIGACAINGGINRLPQPRHQLFSQIYPMQCDDEHPPLPLSTLVKVDAQLPGCPPEGSEILAAVVGLLRNVPPLLPDHAVCMECRSREIRCYLHLDHKPCLGPVTRAGCGARCPSTGVGCEGCRGAFEEANLAEMKVLLRQTGLHERLISSALLRFGDRP